MPTTPNLSLDYPTPLDPATADIWGEIVNDIIVALDSEAATRTINQDFADKELRRALLRDEATKVNALGNVSGAVTVDLSLGNMASMTLTNNTTLTFTNPAPTGNYGYFLLLVSPSTYTLTFPASCENAAGTNFTHSGTSGMIEIYGYTLDAGTLWRVKQGETWL